MKANVSFSVDCELLAKFDAHLKNQKLNPNDVIEKIIRDYISNDNIVEEDWTNFPFGTPDDSNEEDWSPLPHGPGGEEYVELTNKLIMRFKKYKVGAMARNLLEKFLPIGVASETEIDDMQKIPSRKKANELNMPYGTYSNSEFGLNFPLLVKEGTCDFLRAKCWGDPIQIGNETYYICAQWFEQPNNNDRIPLEKWISEHLPIWFANADEEQKKDMEDFIEAS